MNGDFMDMHLHSCYSDDGEYSPAELVEKCAESGIKIMAIADHNCVKAHEEGERAGRPGRESNMFPRWKSTAHSAA